MSKIKIRHTIVAEVEVDTEWYPEEMRKDLGKIRAYEEENGDVGSIIDYITSHKIEVTSSNNEKK